MRLADKWWGGPPGRGALWARTPSSRIWHNAVSILHGASRPTGASAADRGVRPTTLVPALLAFLSLVAQAQPVKDTFRIKYVAEGAVYIEGGRAAGLAEKMRLTVSKPPDVTIDLEVVSVADASAVCEIKTPGAALLEPGDFAKLTSEDAQKSQMLRQVGSGNHYAQTITFSELSVSLHDAARP